MHYGDKIPEQYKNQSEKVNVKDNVVNSVPKQKYTRNKKTSSDKSTAPKKMTKSSKSTAPKKMTKSSTCSKKWEKYNKSVACYDKCAIRLSNGGRDLVFCSKCVDVANPSCKIKN